MTPTLKNRRCWLTPDDGCATERRIFEDLLVRQGFDVVQTENDEQAIAELRRADAADDAILRDAG